MGNRALLKQEKDRITKEEERAVYRESEHRRLARAELCWLKRWFGWLWTALNSQVGGWVLSTVLVGGGVAWWQSHNEQLTKERERTEKREKIADEVAFRIRCYERVRQKQGQTPNQFDVKDRRSALEGSPPEFIYEEFQGRPLVPLLWELAFFCDGSDTKHAIQRQSLAFSDSLASSPKLKAADLEQGVLSLSERIAELLPKDHEDLLPTKSGG